MKILGASARVQVGITSDAGVEVQSEVFKMLRCVKFGVCKISASGVGIKVEVHKI